MKRIVAIVAGVGMALAAGSVCAAGMPEEQMLEARQMVRTLGGQLGGALGLALGEGGAERAISVCREEAPLIAARVSGRSGWDVGRTSLRYRNPDNAPDPWERRVLEGFETRRAAGEAPGRLEFSEVVETGGTRVFRYMKAIPTGRVCLACHGTSLAPEVLATIREAYPGDLAIGFVEGGLRGAFTLKKLVP